MEVRIEPGALSFLDKGHGKALRWSWLETSSKHKRIERRKKQKVGLAWRAPKVASSMFSLSLFQSCVVMVL